MLHSSTVNRQGLKTRKKHEESMSELAFNKAHFLTDLLSEVLNPINEAMTKEHQLWQN